MFIATRLASGKTSSSDASDNMPHTSLPPSRLHGSAGSEEFTGLGEQLVSKIETSGEAFLRNLVYSQCKNRSAVTLQPAGSIAFHW
jgi:hypothetical protein